MDLPNLQHILHILRDIEAEETDDDEPGDFDQIVIVLADEGETRPARTQFRVWISIALEPQNQQFIQGFIAEFRRRLLHALRLLEMAQDRLQNIQDLINQTGTQHMFPQPVEPPVTRMLPQPTSCHLFQLSHSKGCETKNSNPSKWRKISRYFIAISLMIGTVVWLHPTIRQLLS
ncbi:uncharacterized protein TNIN_444781 [Trichonephila inaurata madagascariensis]|uniref:Uncharacterized protein n=1 Tax=Trichonephila inaurata madagascariensis TaxID=2747483 RepID=A0A8X7CUA4_9ARAC|nr:uncharacterized protein TNIN_444781 [Trichonephila inaurata madagascariensis]